MAWTNEFLWKRTKESINRSTGGEVYTVSAYSLKSYKIDIECHDSDIMVIVSEWKTGYPVVDIPMSKSELAKLNFVKFLEKVQGELGAWD